MPDNLDSYVVNGYQANDIIYSIVNMIMEKVKVAPWGLYQVVDEQKLKQYHGFLESKDFVKAKEIRLKALKPIEKPNLKLGKLAELLKWPNECQTFNELAADDAGFICIVGNNYMWANLLDNGANQGLPGELINAPAQHMGIIATNTFPQRAVGYQLNNGFLKRFTKEEILHEKLWNPTYNANGGGLYGQSPIKAALKTLTRNSAAKKAGATQLDNNGAAGIAYVDDALLKPEERKAQLKIVKETWAKEYTGSDNFGKVAFSGFKMGYQSVGMSLKEMALTEVEMVDMRVLCNIWGLPSQLMNDFANKSFNNAKEAEKALTSRCALPRLTSLRNNFNRKIQTDWGFKGVNVIVDFDTSVYAELQEDLGEKWKWVKELTVPESYKLEMMGLDVPDELPKDLILIDSNKVNLQDLVNGGMSDEQLTQVDEALKQAGIYDHLRIAK